jgi:hypothetical protein
MNLQIHDPRPDNMAELAKMTAVELRKRGIWARVNIWHNVEISECVYSLLFSDFDNLGPIACADVIQAKEVRRAQEWALLGHADPNELLNTIPLREYPVPRQFDSDPDREREP